MRFFHLLPPLAAGLLALVGPLPAEEPAASTGLSGNLPPTPARVVPTTAMVEDFRWAGSLGLPDPRGLPLVRVATGHTSFMADREPANSYRHGFLLGANNKGFRVLTPGPFTGTYGETPFIQSFQFTPPGTPESRRVGYETASLETMVDEMVADNETHQVYVNYSNPRNPGQCAALAWDFFWAWTCWRHGLDEPAARLYAQAAKLAGREALRDVLTAEYAFAMRCEAIRAFGDPALSRVQLLAAWEGLARRFHVADAQKTADTLRRMVDEDADYAGKAAPALEKLPGSERARELVYLLRDVSTIPFYSLGWPEAEGLPGSASAQLIALGTEAVPALLAALEDEHFTRTYNTLRSLHGFDPITYEVVTVGECAARLLENIAGRRFEVRSGFFHNEWLHDKGPGSFRAQVEAWFAVAQAKGARQAMADAVAVPLGEQATQNEQWTLISQAQTLVGRYPEGALEPLQAAARHARQADMRNQMIVLLGNLPGDAPVPFLQETLRQSSFKADRAVAARKLCQHGRMEEALAAMIREWREPRPEPEPAQKDQARLLLLPDLEESEVGFLAGCGRVAAVEALGEGLPGRPVGLRRSVLRCLGRAAAGEAGRRKLPGATGEGRDEEARLKAAVEKALAAFLEDTGGGTAGQPPAAGDEEETIPMAVSNSPPPALRVCDEAAAALAEALPDKYRFNFNAPLAERDRQRAECLKVWRKSQE